MSTELKTGLLLINKPARITSYGCIGYLKRIIRKKIKIGHAGTLDPFATGLLIIAIGRQATRLMPQLMTLQKTYTATAKLGELTDTLDCTGTIVESESADFVTKNNIIKALDSFGSSYEQTPPLYSALKHRGDPLYKLVREKRISEDELESIAEHKKKIVQLYSLELISFDFPFFTISSSVSHGTYIRRLVDDIAVRAGTHATTHALERSAIGAFSIERSVGLYDINSIDDINAQIISVESLEL